jgi:hypothetical protein
LTFKLKKKCYTGNCFNGICTGIKAGESCDPLQSAQCDKGLYCSYNNNVCARQRLLQETCDDVEPNNSEDLPDGSNALVICPGGTKCYSKKQGETPKCENVYFRTVYQDCVNNEDCYLPLTCTNGKCHDLSDYDIPCNNEKNCSTSLNERCVCNNPNPPTCKQTGNPECDRRALYQDWIDCWKKNKCEWETNLFNAMITEAFQPETCMFEIF